MQEVAIVSSTSQITVETQQLNTQIAEKERTVRKIKNIIT